MNEIGTMSDIDNDLPRTEQLKHLASTLPVNNELRNRIGPSVSATYVKCHSINGILCSRYFDECLKCPAKSKSVA